MDGEDEFEVGDAHYARRIFQGGTRLTRWSHHRRSRVAGRILHGRKFERVADLGGADGWFLRSLVDRGVAGGGVVIDVDADLLAAGRQSAVDQPSIEFELGGPGTFESHRGAFDLAVCMETLEHVSDPEATLAEVISLVRPGGEVLVTVPVEVGPALLGKQAGRWVANRGGAYGYGRYEWRELVRAGVLWDTDGIDRMNLNSHKGFDYRRVQRALSGVVDIRRTVWSPFHLGPAAATTVSWLGLLGS